MEHSIKFTRSEPKPWPGMRESRGFDKEKIYFIVANKQTEKLYPRLFITIGEVEDFLSLCTFVAGRKEDDFIHFELSETGLAELEIQGYWNIDGVRYWV